jgi:hypothetical protein
MTSVKISDDRTIVKADKQKSIAKVKPVDPKSKKVSSGPKI